MYIILELYKTNKITNNNYINNTSHFITYNLFYFILEYNNKYDNIDNFYESVFN